MAMHQSLRDAPTSARPSGGFRRHWNRRRWIGGLGWWACLAAPGSVLAVQPTARWPYELTCGMFRIHADFEITESSDFLAELDSLVGDVASLLAAPAPTATTHMILFSQADEYRSYIGHYFPKVPQRRALFIQQRGTGMLFAHRHAEMATDLRHESVHALLNEGQSVLPLWLDEGLAEYFEVPADKRWDGHSHLRTIQARLPDEVPELARLEQLDQVGEMSDAHYRDAWAWVHFLLHRRQSTRQMIVQQLDCLRSGRPVRPLSLRLAIEVPRYRQEFVEHFQAVTARSM
jgi:hypothetical protein